MQLKNRIFTTAGAALLAVTGCLATAPAGAQDLIAPPPEINEIRVTGDESGMLYIVRIPNSVANDATIVEDAGELVEETEAMLARHVAESGLRVSDLSPIGDRLAQEGPYPQG